MTLETINRRDIISGLALTAAGVAVAKVMPTSRWHQALVGVTLGAGSVAACRWGDRHANVLAFGASAAFLMSFVGDSISQPAKLLAAWKQRDLWAGIDGIRRFSFATGVVAPAAWMVWQYADQILEGEAEGRDLQYRLGHFVWFSYDETRIEYWLDPDGWAAEFNRRRQDYWEAEITGKQLLEMNGIPFDITEDFWQMSAEQIEGLILKTTWEELPIAKVEQVLEEQGRSWIVDDLTKRGQEAAAVLKKDSWEQLQNDYRNRTEDNAQELRQRLSALANARGMASRIYKRFGERSGINGEMLASWNDLPNQLVQMRLALTNLQVKEEETEEEEAVNTVMFWMRNSNEEEWKDYRPWKEALEIDDLQEMEEVLKRMGLRTKSDLEKHQILEISEETEKQLAAIDNGNKNAYDKDCEKALVRGGQICKALTKYRVKWKKEQQAAGGGVTGAILSYMATPSSLKASMGPGALKALKVVGGVGYLAVWGACMTAHFQHGRYLFYTGAILALLERLIFKSELRARDISIGLPRNNYGRQEGHIGLVLAAWTMQGVMLGEQLQAQWLAGNDIEEIVRGDRPINRDLYGRAMTFGERGPVAQMRVLASETGLSGAYSAAGQLVVLVLAHEWDSEGELPLGTIVVGRSCVHALCDTLMGLGKRVVSGVANWGEEAVVGEGAE